MKVQKLCSVCSAVVVFGVIATAVQAEERGIDSHVLAEMGLDGMAILSDEAATSIRGFGYSHNGAGAYGRSWARVSAKHSSAGSVNGYKANGKRFATGANLSFAAIEVKKSGGHGSKGKRGGKGGHAGKGRKGGGYGYGGHGGHGGKPQAKSIKAVAGGGSFAKAK